MDRSKLEARRAELVKYQEQLKEQFHIVLGRIAEIDELLKESEVSEDKE